MYLKAVVIVHGKSEKIICEYIKSNLRLNIHVASEKNGQNSIQINSLNRFLKRTGFCTEKDFLREFGDKLPPDIKKLPEDFKIFAIMDTDDCTQEQKQKYLNKTMFKNHWAYDFIYPIHNTKKLEDVMHQIGIDVKTKKDYIKIFPINNNGDRKDTDQIKDLIKKLKKNKEITNLHEFFEFCLNLIA